MVDEEILTLTKKLVSIRSVNGTEGEREIGLFLEAYLRSFPYFQKHPDYVIARVFDSFYYTYIPESL